MGLLNFYKNWMSNRSEKEKVCLRQEIKNEIRIVLRNDILWLVVGDEAIYKVNSTDTAEQIINRAKEVFNTAKEYKKL